MTKPSIQEATSIYLGLELPEMRGSKKQITCAENLRQKAIMKLLQNAEQPETIKCILETHSALFCDAVYWMQGRRVIDTYFRDTIKELFVQNIKPYPVQKWASYKDEYAHEGKGGEFIWKCKGLSYEVFPGRGYNNADNGQTRFNIFCRNLETQKWEIWHYQMQHDLMLNHTVYSS